MAPVPCVPLCNCEEISPSDGEVESDYLATITGLRLIELVAPRLHLNGRFMLRFSQIPLHAPTVSAQWANPPTSRALRVEHLVAGAL
jgi:hypothetical protein